MVSIIRRRACPWPYERTSSGSILRALRFGRRPSRLSFSDGAFDVITAVETHFWWPALPTDLREVLRVLKPGGRLILIAEVYRGAESFTSKAAERYSEKTGMALLSVEEHRELLTASGYSDLQIVTEPKKGWI